MLCGHRNQTRDWDSKVSYVPQQIHPALNGVQPWREPNTLTTADAGPSLGPANTPTSANMALFCCHGLVLTRPMGFSKLLPYGGYNELMINFPFSFCESLGAGFETGIEGLAISGSCLSL